LFESGCFVITRLTAIFLFDFRPSVSFGSDCWPEWDRIARRCGMRGERIFMCVLVHIYPYCHSDGPFHSWMEVAMPSTVKQALLGAPVVLGMVVFLIAVATSMVMLG
jgi:hypothetical protein